MWVNKIFHFIFVFISSIFFLLLIVLYVSFSLFHFFLFFYLFVWFLIFFLLFFIMIFLILILIHIRIHFLFILLQAYVNGLRFILTILGGAIAVMGSKAIGYPSAGALGCVTVSFIAGIGWKRQMEKLTPQQLQAYENVSAAPYFVFVICISTTPTLPLSPFILCSNVSSFIYRFLFFSSFFFFFVCFILCFIYPFSFIYTSLA